MKTISLRIQDDIYDKIISFLDLLPKDKINYIPYADDQEQQEIEDLLKDPECKEFSGYETTIEI